MDSCIFCTFLLTLLHSVHILILSMATPRTRMIR
jgi:hypothetical protein